MKPIVSRRKEIGQFYETEALTCGLFCLFLAQSCPTLHDPMDCSWPVSSVHGILQAKNTGMGCHFLLQIPPMFLQMPLFCMCIVVQLYCWDLWTVAQQAPQSMGFFMQEYWNGLPFSFSSGLFCYLQKIALELS